MTWFKGLSRLLIAISLLLVAGLAILLVLIIDTQPLVEANSAAQVEEADSVALLLPQLRNAYARSQHPQVLSISAEQLDSLAGVVQRARAGVRGQVNITQDAGLLAVSYKLPFPGTYLNLNAELKAGKGIQLGTMQLGSLNLPGDWVLSLVSKLVDWKLDADIASALLDRVRQVDISNSAVAIRLAPFADLLQELRELPPSALSPEDARKQQRVHHYLGMLDKLQMPGSDTVSLHYYLQPLFAEALRRSTGADAVEENESALLALAIYTGNRHFARFVGIEALPRNGHRVNIVLSDRQDLHLHFVYSVAIKLLSDQGISIAVGEFKELMDRGEGGSGYSFVDLAADMAGVRLAKMALEPDTAELIQRRLAQAEDESVFFPQVLDLPEGMDKEEFARRFEAVDSPAYQQLVNKIRERLDTLALYQP
ncbi:hypothetical protein [Lacimicrobium alkaliphilum]|uniref:Uncharacterized protein n=1 Tax=Lacimicrobium alkaliphilum TaxID=1526571 RepID=A0A0U3B7B6_9ALTE|nr:hypothetical protein [Lacimicrobium alkaliphilum]ALS97525.1 hypothetical protein AT746_04065 [Lacimicrobium alkaliphilum]